MAYIYIFLQNFHYQWTHFKCMNKYMDNYFRAWLGNLYTWRMTIPLLFFFFALGSKHLTFRIVFFFHLFLPFMCGSIKNFPGEWWGQRNNFVFRRAGCLFSSFFNWQIIVCRRTRFFKIVRRNEWATLPMKYHAYCNS